MKGSSNVGGENLQTETEAMQGRGGMIPSWKKKSRAAALVQNRQKEWRQSKLPLEGVDKRKLIQDYRLNHHAERKTQPGVAKTKTSRKKRKNLTSEKHIEKTSNHGRDSGN